MEEEKEYLTVEETAKLLGVNRITIYRMLYDGRLKGVAFKIYSHWRINRQALQEWVIKNSQNPRPMQKHKKRRRQ